MTNDEYRQALLDMAHQLMLLATGEADAQPPIAYPREVTFDGARFMAALPINPNWKPSQYARIFGRNMVLPDPSNAPKGQPMRSPAGYPLTYMIPERPPRVLYGDSTFADDGQVERFRAELAASQAAAEQRDRAEGNVFRTPGEVEVCVEQG